MSRAYNRDVARRKALSRRQLARKIYSRSDEDYYDNLHQYSKNSIHCSCPSCSAKTRNKGKRRYKSGNYSPHINYKVSDLRHIVNMDEDEFETLGRIHNSKRQSKRL